jgi:hypothetical protein
MSDPEMKAPGALDHVDREHSGVLLLPPAESRRRLAAVIAFAGLAYGHCGKKFAENVPGEVLHVSPPPDTVTFV